MYRSLERLRGHSAKEIDHLADDSMRAGGAGCGIDAVVQVLGHKADLMFICFRRSFDELAQAQLALSRTQLHESLEPPRRMSVVSNWEVRDDREDSRASSLRSTSRAATNSSARFDARWRRSGSA